jgi:hypothetical protein
MFGGPPAMDQSDWDVIGCSAPIVTILKGDYLLRQGLPNKYVYRYAQ